MLRQRLSLKARALQWLAQREHSRLELRRKLLRVARADQARRTQAQAAAAAQGAADDGAVVELSAAVRAGDGYLGDSRPSDGASPDGASSGCADPERCVDQLLDWLQQHGYLSEARFIESRVLARGARYGNLRINQELAQHRLSPDDDTLQQLRASELDRARAVWRQKFGAPADGLQERARQVRFLAQRGFSAEVIRKVVNGLDDDI